MSYVPGTNYIGGIPEGLDFDELNELCEAYTQTTLKSVSYYPLSGWKRSTAFRLLLQTKTGDKWNIIYKNALYRKELIPALSGFPINPGPPEYTIYSNAEGEIAKYLPTIHMCREVVPGLHYRYLMQDLNKHYRPAIDRSDILSITSELLKLYDIIGECNYNSNEDSFIIYNKELSSRLKPYIIESLERYARATNSRKVSTVCDNWNNISALYDYKYDYSDLYTVIHGDSNLANILVHKQSGSKIKFIDWEWAGIGLPHQDLASLLKRAKPEVERAALEIFSQCDRSISGEEHRRLYEVCQLERGLIDCAFLANQVAGSTDKTKMDIAGYIEDSASRAVGAYIKLR